MERNDNGSLGSMMDRVLQTTSDFEQSLQRERRLAPGLMAELLGHPASRRQMFLRNSRRFRTFALTELLINLSHRLGFCNPPECREIAELATLAASELPAEAYSASARFDLRARAWSQLGNAHRILGDFAASKDAFQVARKQLAYGSHDPLELARVQDLEASLETARQHHERALDLLDEAIQVYHLFGETRLEGKAEMKRGITLLQADLPDKGITSLNRSAEILDGIEAPRLQFMARHNLLAAMVKHERFLEAKVLLEGMRPQYETVADEATRVRGLGLEGSIAYGLGEYQSAAIHFFQVRRWFLENDAGLDAAKATLDLAATYLRLGKTARVKALALEMIPVFRSRQIQRESLAALLLFQQAAMGDRLTFALLREMRSYLDLAERQPNARFTPSA